jgi:hypothetical protein
MGKTNSNIDSSRPLGLDKKSAVNIFLYIENSIDDVFWIIENGQPTINHNQESWQHG